MNKLTNKVRVCYISKTFSCLAVIAALLVIPTHAYAADGTIGASGTYDVGDYGNDSVITINPGLTVTLTDTSGVAYTNMQIACGAGVALTMDGVKIDDTLSDNVCPLSFTGSGNTLVLEGESDLRAGATQPGVKVESLTSLELSGGGTLSALGGAKASGIGGGCNASGGTITINGGTITAQGGADSAGIGGGYSGGGGVTTIKGGTVNAQGMGAGAGIGGGYHGTSGPITIEGGTVNATGGSSGAGIGNGTFVEGQDLILIKGGRVTAVGGAHGPGIGSGYMAEGGTFWLFGGVIYAQKGPLAAYDIGNDNTGLEELRIAGDAAVFLSADQCITPTTSHTHKMITSVTDNKVYEVSVAGWAPPFGAYIAPCTLTYDANGGTGPVPASVTQHMNTTVAALAGGEGLSRGGGAFICWNTAADGSGTDYTEGDPFTLAAETTLYAKYPVMVNEIKVTSPSDTVTRTQTLQMSADVLPADATDKSFTWSVQSGTGSASIDGSGLLTGIAWGTVTVKATADDGSLTSGTKEITVTPRPVTISASGTYDLGDYGSGSVIAINPGLTVTLTDTGGAIYTNVQVACGAGVNLTMDGVKIDDTINDSACPLSFDGSGNALVLEGASDLRAGANQPGVKVDYPTSLELSGGGTLNALGGSDAAGIGGGNNGTSGTITINSGTITAQGGAGGAGIGGGTNGSGGIIMNGGTVNAQGGTDGAGIGGGYGHAGGATINGGTVNAQGVGAGAGIGGGYGGNNGSITIKGGTVNATGGSSGPGIGSGAFANSNNDIILITGGRVAAIGGGRGAGIGGGYMGEGGSFYLYGGVIYAQKGPLALYDIGSKPPVDLRIGDAAVFLSADECNYALPSHFHKTMPAVIDNKVYGVSIAGWAPPLGAYISPVTLSYSANGGTGTGPGSVIQHINTSGSVVGGSGFARVHYLFAGWSTAADGSGTDYAPGDSIPFAADTTLYAQWVPNEYTVSFQTDGGSAVSSLSADGGTTITAPAAPTKPGFTFAGWYKEPGCIHTWDFGSDTVPGNITLYAKWLIVVYRYTVSFDSQGGSTVGDISADYDARLTAPPAPTKAGFTFAGWYREPECVTTWDFKADTVPGDITLYAKWTATSYTLRYRTQPRGTLKGTLTQTVAYGGDGTMVTAVPGAGYHFVRWSDGVSLASRTDRNIKANLDVTAQFARNLYTLKYTAGKHGSLTGNGSQRVPYGASGTKVTAVPAAHYHFVRWSDGVTVACRTDTNVSRNIDVTALFAVNTYQVVFKDYDGRILKKQTVAYGRDAAPPAAPKRAGYVFTGWSGDYKNVTARVTLRAIYSRAASGRITVVISTNGLITTG